MGSPFVDRQGMGMKLDFVSLVGHPKVLAGNLHAELGYLAPRPGLLFAAPVATSLSPQV